MRTARWLVAAGLLASATGCIEVNGLPNTSMGGYPAGYGYPSSGYYGGSNYGYGQPSYASGGGLLNSLFSQPSYYSPAYQPAPQYIQPAPQYIPVPVASPPQIITQPRYVPVPAAGNGRPSWANHDRNNNGIPDWKERDRNGDGIPDWQQRHHRSG